MYAIRSYYVVILDGNILETPEGEIEHLQVAATLFEGQIVYQREGGGKSL